MNLGTLTLDGDKNLLYEVGNDATSLSLHCKFTGLDAGTGVLRIQTNNDNGSTWTTVLLNLTDGLTATSVTVSTGASDEFFAIDRCAVGKFVRINFTANDVTEGTMEVISNEAHT